MRSRLARIVVAFDEAVIESIFQPGVNLCRTFAGPKELGLFALMGYIVSNLADAVVEQRAGTINATVCFSIGVNLATGLYLYRQSLRHYNDAGTPGAYRMFFLFRLIRTVLFFWVVASWMLASLALYQHVGGSVVAGLGSLLYVACLYLFACRKPPPRKRRAPLPGRLARANSS